MHDDALKELWRTQPVEPAPPLPDSRQLEEMKSRMKRLNRTLFWRDRRENSAAVVVMVVFGLYFLLFTSPLARAGCVMVVLGSLVVMAYPMWRKRRVPRAAPDATLMRSLECELRRVEVEIGLLRSVLWWYLLPGAVGVVVFLAGIHVSVAVTILMVVFVIALDIFVYWINQVACDRRLLPLKRELESLLGLDGTAPPPESRRRHIVPILILLVLGLLAVAFLWAALAVKEPRVPGFEDVSGFDERDIGRIDAWLREQVALARFPGLSVAVVSDGRIVYQNAFGFEDIKSGRKATPETSFHVASVTKVFTTSLAAMLDESGVIDLDQPAVRYLPEGVSISTRPELGATITLRQLASHTSGLPRGIPGRVQSVDDRYALEPERLYRHLAVVKLAHDPGTDELYSNLGMGLLGHVLECAAGKPFDQLLREMLCEPLGLARTAIQVNDTLHVATGYGSGLPRSPEPHSYHRRLAPSGGLIASAPDLARFLSAQMKPGLLSSETLAQLHAPAKLADGSPAGSGLGWRVRRSQAIGMVLSKNGGRNNCGAWIGFAPEHGVGVAVVTNCGKPNVDPIGIWLLERCVPGGRKPVAKRPPR